MGAVTFKDNYVIMTSLVMSHHWIFITRRANLILSITDERGSCMVREINMGVCPRLDFEILCYLIVWGITLIFMVRFEFLFSIANL